jgi:hypothetical protein
MTAGIQIPMSVISNHRNLDGAHFRAQVSRQSLLAMYINLVSTQFHDYVSEKVMNDNKEHHEYRGRKTSKVNRAWEIRFGTVL